MTNDRLIDWLSERAREVTTLTSICTESLLLAKAAHDHRIFTLDAGECLLEAGRTSAESGDSSIGGTERLSGCSTVHFLIP